MTDGQRMPLKLVLSPGQDHDDTQDKALLEAVTAQHAVTDFAYDSNKFREAAKTMGKELIVMPHPNRKNPPPLNKPVSATRYNVDCFFHDLKRFRCIASRYEKTARNELSLAHVACAMIRVGAGCI